MRSLGARTRILVVIGVAAVAAVVAVAFISVRGSSGPSANQTAARKGAPPLALDLGLREDAQTKALRRGVTLYSEQKRAQAGAIFDQYSSLPAQIGSAFAGWPNGTVSQLEGMANRYPDNSLVLLNLGLARYWSGDNSGAVEAWTDAYEAQPDTQSSLTADRLLHPNTPQGIPVFVPSFTPPGLHAKTAAGQLAELAAAARRRDVRARLAYGIALQRVGREVSAERAYQAAAKVAPNDPEPLVAEAVARFSRSQPARAFSRLGPLAKRFPHAPTVRFHLGLLLAYSGDIADARKQFRKAVAIDSSDPLAREAARFLEEMNRVQRPAGGRTQPPKR
jgi:tetratricopeptide (TPR) repeat protein